MKTINFHTHIITLPASLKQALLLPEPAEYLKTEPSRIVFPQLVFEGT